jgi:hypothetical protein
MRSKQIVPEEYLYFDGYSSEEAPGYKVLAACFDGQYVLLMGNLSQAIRGFESFFGKTNYELRQWSKVDPRKYPKLAGTVEKDNGYLFVRNKREQG